MSLSNCTYAIKSFSCLLIALALQCAHQVTAQTLIEPFSNSTLISSDTLSDHVYQVPLGILQRSSGRASPEKSLRVTGKLSKLLYEIPSGFSGDEIENYFIQQFDRAGFDELFSCDGRACGSSNDWANDVFGNRVLYGPSQNQYLMVYADNSRHPVNYFVCYIITRGNGRLYGYLEILEPLEQSEDAVSMIARLIANGFVSIPGLEFENDELLESDDSLSKLNSLLTLNPDIALYIVAHIQGSEDFNTLQERSLQRANSVVSALLESGIEESRLSAKGVGPLAPSCGSETCQNRVEAVLIRANLGDQR